MKKSIILLALVMMTGASFAQNEGFSKGSIFATGSIGFASEKFDEDKATAFTFNPKVGYFVSPKIAVGLNLGFTTAKEDDGFSEMKINTFNLGAFGRYYFTPANKFSIFLNLGVDYVNYKEEETGFEDYIENGFSVAFSPGFNYFLTKRLALETSMGLLGFSSMKPDFDGAEATTNFAFVAGISNINFGLVYKFR
ncbi:MAG: porin family protein [Ferruginibacter sp.]|nr:porin family protein [Ferruginibacter sp.]